MNNLEQMGLDIMRIVPILTVVGHIYGNDRKLKKLSDGHIDKIPPGDVPKTFSGGSFDGTRFGGPGRSSSIEISKMWKEASAH
jgi:hypothetical protein